MYNKYEVGYFLNTVNFKQHYLIMCFRYGGLDAKEKVEKPQKS